MNTVIETQSTPNPNALKFLINKDVIAKGKASFSTKQECPHVPLASALFDITSVNQIHFFENVITVTKSEARSWEDVNPQVKQTILDLIDSHKNDFEVLKNEDVPNYEDLSPEIKEINEILDRTIRPGLQSDGGDLEVLDYKDNTVSIRYQGACGSCPSSTSGTLYAIEGILKDEFNPEIKVVTD